MRQVQEQEALPPNTGTVVMGTGPVPKAGIPGRGATTGGGTTGVTGGATVGCTTGVTGAQDTEVFPNESRKAVQVFLRFWRMGWHDPHASTWNLL